MTISATHERTPPSSALRFRMFFVLETFALTFLSLGLILVSHLVSPYFGVGASLLLGIGIALAASTSAPIIVLLSFLFQNLFIALLSPAIGSEFTMTAMRSSNFVLTLCVWGALMFGQLLGHRHVRGKTPENGIVMGVIFLVLIYFLIGFLKNPENALIYLRNIVTPLVILSIALSISRIRNISSQDVFAVTIVIMLIYGYAEFAFGRTFWELVNGETYWRLSGTRANLYPLGHYVEVLNRAGYVTREIFEETRVPLFNFEIFADLDFNIRRPTGPNLQPIGFGYAISAIVVTLFAWRRWVYLGLALPLIFLIGSKGAAIFLALCLMGVLVSEYSRSWKVFYGFVALLSVYVVVAFLIAVSVQNFHALGLIAGFESMGSNLLGQGIGSSGNLTVGGEIDWSRAQRTGSTDVVVESAVAVLVHQMGVFGLSIIALNAWLAHRAWRIFQATGNRVASAAALMMLAITANGVFQEEAMFSPGAQGTIMLIIGMVVGRYGAQLNTPHPTQEASHVV